jgi:hypothetical protein
MEKSVGKQPIRAYLGGTLNHVFSPVEIARMQQTALGFGWRSP